MHCVVVLGCKPDTDRLTERAAAAAQAWSALQRSDATLLCTGFASQAGLPAEANLIAAQAESAGVPSHCISVEDQAKNTIENALLCLPLLQQYNISHVVLVTSDYHMPRSRLLFELVLNGTGIHLTWAEAFSDVSAAQRLQLEQQEVTGMKHLLALALRPDFHHDMLRDRSLTHPDLLQPCGVITMQQAETAIAAKEKLQKCLSRRLSSGGGSMQQLLNQAFKASSQVKLQPNEEQLIAVAYPAAAAM